MEANQKLTKTQSTDFSQENINSPQKPQYNTDFAPPVANQQQIQIISQSSPNANQMLNEPKTPQYLVIMPKVCLGIGIITILGIALSIFGIFTPSSSSGMDMLVSLLVIGGIYYAIMAGGSILCVVTIVLILLAKHKHHISIKEPLVITIVGMTMICLPNIILLLL